MIRSKFNIPSDGKGTFSSPEKLPTTVEDAKNWQEANRSFWEKNSMRYDWNERIQFDEFSDGFYKEINKRFFGAIWQVMPWKEAPFEQWLDFKALKDKGVLEIGIGNGTHAQLIAPRTKSYTGIDLTEYAVSSTRKRLDLFGIAGTIIQMDAEKLEFTSESFDFVWSWGVIHHSSNTDRILSEIHRVLKPRGKSVLMVYYRSWFSYYLGAMLRGVVKGQFLKGKTIHQIMQTQTDGALARYYTLNSWAKLVRNRFEIRRMEILGNKPDILPIPAGRFKNLLLEAIPTWLARLCLKNLKMGSFLICELEKK